MTVFEKKMRLGSFHDRIRKKNLCLSYGEAAMTRQPSRREVEQCSKALDTCACLNLRNASRAITRYFDTALRPCGLRQTQMPILVMLVVHERISVTQLAQQLVMDPSTMTRSLKTLAARGVIAVKFGKGGHTQAVSLTPRGRALLTQALPLWEHAQKQFVTEFGPQRWQQLQRLLPAVQDVTQGHL